MSDKEDLPFSWEVLHHQLNSANGPAGRTSSIGLDLLVESMIVTAAAKTKANYVGRMTGPVDNINGVGFTAQTFKFNNGIRALPAALEELFQQLPPTSPVAFYYAFMTDVPDANDITLCPDTFVPRTRTPSEMIDCIDRSPVFRIRLGYPIPSTPESFI